MSDSVIRTYRSSDEHSFLELQAKTFRGLEYLPRVKSGLPVLEPEGSFVAEKRGSIVGCVGLFRFDRPRWYEIRNLAFESHEDMSTGKKLIEKALTCAKSKNAEYVKASTPAVEPYVDLYKEMGFNPVRRSLRIAWDLEKCETRESKIMSKELSSESANDAAEVWVRGLRPYWDYWIEEQGGPEPLEAWVKESVVKRQGWIGAFVDEKLVGVSILRPDYYGPGEARFNGAYAIPESRKQGIGSALMVATIRQAKKQNQKTMRVYTLAFLDHLAPGAVLYLKTGGRIEGEYLQLESGKFAPNYSDR